ncbi:protein SCAR2-like isoform X2 [Durio zibethinus]|uniref:Protein SCAR n=1 Tax=Durio zibethinus TaxID=66656 RepID=A0A6P5Z7F8_DURZI|nr:protein SCAR2-like isoform X2 [Durio zibethinus]XP_022748461.1 protein SCAR2-like isoform X2 [Durio zibethinus]
MHIGNSFIDQDSWFAAEIFHDLHEELMATAARGHGLMARVLQLEAEFSSIERAFLSQTNHSLFFTNIGVDWHPNLRTEHNLITRGDLPYCVLDSYEECRGPPRLFLLDKFDVAGAGASLKRYTDPSFFKSESAFPGIALVEVQREKKARKVKKKGSRWSNGDTPEFATTSHAKLHQLFLEERIENAYNDPARLVKLKRRQLNESPLDSKSGKSYMEKFLETPSLACKAVCETSGTPPPVRSTLDNSSESWHEISAVSPVKKSAQGKETSSSSPSARVVLKPSTRELNGEVIDREIVKMPDPTANFTDGILLPLHKVTIEKEMIVDGEGRKECSIDGDHSDDMASEVDNYMDALTSMESEIDTDNEFRSKNDIGFINFGKYRTGSDANEEKLEVQAHSSDSQSVGISSASDGGNCLFKKGRSSFSYSDTMDNLAEDVPSDGDVAARVFPSDKNSVTEIVKAPSIQFPACSEMQCSSSDKVLSPKDTFFGECRLADLGEASYSSCLEDLNSTYILLDQASSMEVSLPEPQLDEVCFNGVKKFSDLSDSDGGKYLADSSEVILVDSSEKQEVSLISLSSESHPVDELDSGDTNVSSDAFLHLSNILQLAPERRSANDPLDEVLKAAFSEESCAENSVNQMIGSPNSVIQPTEEQLPFSTSAEVERSSGIILSPEGLDVMKPVNLSSEVNDDTLEAGLNSECMTPLVETSQTCGFNERQFSDILHDDTQLEADPTDIGSSYSEQKQNVDELFDAAEGEETRESTCSVNAVEGDAIPFDLPSHCNDNLDLKDHVGLDDLATKNVHAESIAAVSIAAFGSADFDDAVDNTSFQSSNLICSLSGKLMNLEESLSGDGELCQEILESNEVISQVCLIELDTRQERNQVEGALADIDSTSCKSVTCNNSNLEDDSLAELTKNSLNFIDLTTAPSSLELSDQDSESKYLSHLMDSGEEVVSSPTYYLSEKETSIEQSLDFHTNQHDVGSLHTVEDSSNSLNPVSNQIPSLDHVDQEKCLQTSFEHSKEGSSSQPSLEVSQQSVRQDKQASYPSDPIHPAFVLQSEPTKVSMEAMPPLPPLPPMQWRIGRVQHVSSAAQRELVEHGQESFPMITQYRTDEKAQFGLSALEKGIELSRNPFLPVLDGEEKSGNVSDQLAANFMQPCPFSFLPPTADYNANSQYNGACLNRTHSNPYLTLAIIPIESLECGSIAMEGDRVEASCSLPMPATDTACRRIPVSSDEKTTYLSNQFVLDTGLEGEHHKQNSEGEHENPPDISLPPPTKREVQIRTKVAEDLPANVEGLFPVKEEEQPQHGLAASARETAQTSDAIFQHGLTSPEEEIALASHTTLQDNLSTSEREAAWSSNTLALLPVVEDGNSNGNPTIKLPRPRNPLIDAVAAHGKSKLRKVTEQVRHPIIPKIDERDSLLEQIRAKSFNLKPAVVTRPSIQGPKTNLKVAAIFEKANAIRQALAGSDEDDDEDGWSDS